MNEFFLNLPDLVEEGNLPNVRDYQYYKCLSENTILINRDIDDDLIEYAILPLEQMDRDPDVKHITVLLSTLGGSIRPGMQFIDALERVTTPVTLRVIGDADSMGTLIVMAKSEHLHKVCDKWCVGLIHAGSQSASGDTNSVNDQIKFNQRYEKMIEEYIMSHTLIDKKLYAKIKRQELWMTAEDMLKYGIIDEII